MPAARRVRLSLARALAPSLFTTALSLWTACSAPPADEPAVDEPAVDTPVDEPVDKPAAPFDAAVAFDEFERTLRETYAYLDRADFDVEAFLDRVRAAALRTREPAELRRLLHRATFAFADPHLLVAPLDDTDPNVGPTAADLAIALHDGRYLVADVRAGSAADAAGVRPGWEVRAVDGEALEARITALLADLVPEPTPRQRTYAATLVVNGRRGAARAVEFLVEGAPRRLELANPRELARRVDTLAPLEVDEREGVTIVRFNNSLGRPETIAAFDAAIRERAGSRAMILDLRNTPSGGNTDIARAILGHFVAEARPYQVHEIPAVERRTSVPRRFIELAMPRAPRFAGRLAVLGGRWTGSMGEGLLIGLHAAAGARTFASDLGDLLGALEVIELPASRAVLELGSESLFHVDGTPRADYVADVPLASADRDAAGDDPALRVALDWLAAPP